MVETITEVFVQILVTIVLSYASWQEDATTGLGFHISWNQMDTDTANFTRTIVALDMCIQDIQNIQKMDQESEKVEWNTRPVNHTNLFKPSKIYIGSLVFSFYR